MTAPRDEGSVADSLDRALSQPPAPAGVLDDDMADLVRFALSLEPAASTIVPTQEFRAAARQRLLVHMAQSQRAVRHVGRAPQSVGERIQVWAFRLGSGLAALTVTGAASATASASALPGDPLYAVKLAAESVTVRLATSESTRQDILLDQADRRLDEAARLLEQGREADVIVAAARYDETIARLDPPTLSPASDVVQSNLQTNEMRLTELLQTAPVSARQGLERALSATDRGLSRSRARAPVPTATDGTLAAPGSEEHAPGVALGDPRANLDPARTADTTDHERRQPDVLRPADAGERKNGAAHAAAEAADASRVIDGPPAATLAEVEPGRTAPAPQPSSESRGIATREGDPTVSVNPHAAPNAPGHALPERTAVPPLRPGGRGRP